MRIQDSEQSATLSLNDNNSSGVLDFELQWGPDTQSKFRLNFINSITNPSAITTAMTALPNGRVGFGTDNPINARVVVQDNSTNGLRATSTGLLTSGVAGEGGLYGVLGRASGANTSGGIGFIQYGVFGLAGNGVSANYGVFGEADNRDNPNRSAYGVSGRADVSPNSFAGFFFGNVNVTGTLTQGSDRRLKEDIQDESATLEQIMQLRPTTYQFKTKGEYADINLATGQQHGFIAQELEEVFPELVGRATAMLGQNLDEENFDPGRPFEFRTVNYMALIPILTKGMQEQQGIIVTQQAEIEEQGASMAEKDLRIQRLEEEMDEVKAQLAALQGDKAASKVNSASANPNETPSSVLYQNVPNPFSESTQIRYALAPGATGQMLIFDMNGRQLRAYDLDADADAVTIRGNELDAGMYLYSLIVNGEEVDTRRMILTK